MEGFVSAGAASERGMAEDGNAERRIVVIDDDDLSRELLTLIAMEAGFDVDGFASGEDAIAELANRKPEIILTDMQMPGISGCALAEQLRGICGKDTMLLAMSGSEVEQEELSAYDGFLLKPFSADDLKAASREAGNRRPAPAAAELSGGQVILDEKIYANFARRMPAGQLLGLYKMCLDDSANRVATMRQALEDRDDAAYRRAAHAIKGGCGMVGAVELARMAAEMETSALPAEQDAAPLDHFLAASARLGRMLDSKASGMRDTATASSTMATS